MSAGRARGGSYLPRLVLAGWRAVREPGERVTQAAVVRRVVRRVPCVAPGGDAGEEPIDVESPVVAQTVSRDHAATHVDALLEGHLDEVTLAEADAVDEKVSLGAGEDGRLVLPYESEVGLELHDVAALVVDVETVVTHEGGDLAVFDGALLRLSQLGEQALRAV